MKIIFLFLAITFGITSVQAQQRSLQYFRPNSKAGLNIFETPKNDTVTFDGLKVRLGGNFTQDFQSLRHENNASPVMLNDINTNQLASLKNGFNLAMANLNIDAQLADGVRMNLTMYLSSRHHEETWVKGGYIQLDKLPFLNSPVLDKLMEHITIKVGDYEVDYGDQHYRRTDGGNAIYNPFVENYIMDAFNTEIGGEVYYHTQSGFIAMAGITNGELNPNVVNSSKIDSATGKLNTYAPAFHGKLGFDRQMNKDLRVRLTGSFYTVKSAAGNTLFSGDRTGSHYFFVMENTTATAADNFRSGRYAPQYSQQVTTFVVNPFVKYKGLELFGTYEVAKGRTIAEKEMRTTTQYAIDLLYRVPQLNENLWIGGRYNSLTGTLPFKTQEITINRIAASVGYFFTKNIMLKGEYVSQVYKNFAGNDIRSGGKFSGFLVEAVVGF